MSSSTSKGAPVNEAGFDQEQAKDYSRDKQLPFYGSHISRPRHDSNYSPEIMKKPEAPPKPTASRDDFSRPPPSENFNENRARLASLFEGKSTKETPVKEDKSDSVGGELFIVPKIETPTGTSARSRSRSHERSEHHESSRRRSSRHRHHRHHRSSRRPKEDKGQVAVVPKASEAVIPVPKPEEKQVQVIKEHIIEKHYYHAPTPPAPQIVVQNNLALDFKQDTPRRQDDDEREKEWEKEKRRLESRLKDKEKALKNQQKKVDEDRKATEEAQKKRDDERLEEERQADKKRQEKEKSAKAKQKEADKKAQEAEEARQAAERYAKDLEDTNEKLAKQKRADAKARAKEDKERESRRQKDEWSRQQEAVHRKQVAKDQKQKERELKEAADKALAKASAEKDKRRKLEKKLDNLSKEDAKVIEQVSNCGVCPMQFDFVKEGDGLRCEGGNHYVEGGRLFERDASTARKGCELTRRIGVWMVWGPCWEHAHYGDDRRHRSQGWCDRDARWSF